MTPGNPTVLPLSQASQASLAGGKAINLARLLQAGFQVPDGFVVTTEAFLQHRDGAALPAIKREILAAYHEIGSPVVAVRSSATAEDLAEASMAGQYETVLDVQGDAALLEAVQRCWASLTSPRALAYLEENHLLPNDVAMAVVVQELVPADVAGVLFTANPRTGSREEMLIEATWGLGESLVSGIVQPDSLTLDRTTGAVRECIIADKQIWIEPGSHAQKPVPEAKRNIACLDSKSLRELWSLGLRVADHFGTAQDLEWAIYQGKLYLLQSRAITTLQEAEAYEQCLGEAREQLREASAAGRGEWVRHNLGETLPHPTPLTWSVIRRFMSGGGGFGTMYREAGFQPGPAVESEGFLDLIAGRVYMDLSRASEMFFEDFPFSYDVDLLRSNPAAAQEAPTLPSGPAMGRMSIGRKLNAATACLQKLSVDFDQKLGSEIIPAFQKWVRAEKSRELSALTTAEWLALWKEREKRVMDEFAPQSLLPSLIVGLALEQLRSFLAEIIWDEDAEALANLLASGGPPDETLKSNQGLYEIATGTLAVDDWLKNCGHRAPAEFDLATPRWRERPEAVLSMAAHLKDSTAPLASHSQRGTEVARRVSACKEKLSAADGLELDARIAKARNYLRFREDGKHALMLGYDLLRDMALDAGRRLGIGDEVFLLKFDELHDALLTGFAPLHLIEQRRLARSAEARVTLPHVIGAADLAKLGEPIYSGSEQRLDAFPVSSGTGSGPVRIVLSPEAAGDLGKGYVLVCPSTDPNWTPLFVNAAGLILECGGMLSHGAVVAREMGIPAVILAGATSFLKEGETLFVDGRHGAILRGAQTLDAGEKAAEAVDPDDIRIPPELVPPPPGARERQCGKLLWGFLVFWLIYLALAYLLPEAWLYRPSMNVLDAVLWPIVTALGKPAVAIIVACAMATLTMVGQRLMTDNRRLLVAKDRSGRLSKEAAKLPADSPRRAAMMKLVGPVQMRIMAAAFVPLAVFLGPMVMAFLWFPERVDPLSWNAKPGAGVDITAEISGDFQGPVHIELDPALKLEERTPSAQSIPPIRATLEKLQAQWQQPSDLAAQPWEVRAAALKAREEMLADLSGYLQKPIPPQSLSWSIRTPEKQAGKFTLKLVAEGSSLVQSIVLGDVSPPVAKELLAAPGSPIQKIKVSYREKKTKDDQIFWTPFAALGWKWNVGWLMAYLIAYIPAMFGLRGVLKIP
jgi:rifampicin phosphotransferase